MRRRKPKIYFFMSGGAEIFSLEKHLGVWRIWGRNLTNPGLSYFFTSTRKLDCFKFATKHLGFECLND
jgi:hypothetical protein